MTQKEKILGILKAKGSYGMNSYEFRMQFIQLPARISDLKKLGHKIVSVDQKNRSVNYILISSPTKPVEVSKPVEQHNDHLFINQS